MSINLYSTTSESHVVDKKLSSKKTYSSYSFKDETSMINPVVLLNISGVTGISGCNYMYISDFGRYYFVTDIIVVHKNLVEIHGHVDVLYTYRSEIRNMKAVVIRSEDFYNSYITDNVPTYADQLVVTKKFPTAFDTSNASFVVITAGGGSS